MAQYIVRHPGEDRKFTYEQYEVYQEAWDRYGQLCERMSNMYIRLSTK